jgi:hypothetical protein
LYVLSALLLVRGSVYISRYSCDSCNSGNSGYSGRSGYSGYSGRSGYSGYSGYSSVVPESEKYRFFVDDR